MKARRKLYNVATQHGQVFIINCYIPHGRRAKEYVAQLRMEYVNATEQGPVMLAGDSNMTLTGR